MVENENETMRDRVSDLEKRVHDQNDEITCLRATLADALRRINTLEAGKGKENYNFVVIYIQWDKIRGKVQFWKAKMIILKARFRFLNSLIQMC